VVSQFNTFVISQLAEFCNFPLCTKTVSSEESMVYLNLVSHL